VEQNFNPGFILSGTEQRTVNCSQFSGTLANVDSAERVTLFVPGTTFLHINGVLARFRRSDHCGDCVKGFEYECLE